MSIFDSSYCGSIWHHGIKGQRWGVRRTPEQLGYGPKSMERVAESEEHAKIVDGIYHSTKGFSVAVAKLAKYCLNSEKPHAKEFFDVGYRPDDSDQLFKDIERGFDLAKAVDGRKNAKGQEQFRIPMKLGRQTSLQKWFSTCWQIDFEDSPPKMTTAYRDRRIKEDDETDV